MIPNDRLLQLGDIGVSLMDAFRSADEVLLSGVQGITDLITTPGLINLDFADVKSVMSGAGSALMGIGSARGEGRAVQAAEKAINSPLLEASMDGAHGALLSIAGGSDLGLFEINEAASLVQESAHPEANIIFGTIIDDSLGDEVRVTVIAAGFDAGAPTHKKLDPAAFGSGGGSTVSADSGQPGGSNGSSGATGPAGAGSMGQGGQQQGNGSQQPVSGGNGYQSAGGTQRPQPSMGQSGTGSHSGSLPQPGAGNRGYPAPRSGGPVGGQGSLPGRAVPVTEDPSDDDVDVPPFMRR